MGWGHRDSSWVLTPSPITQDINLGTCDHISIHAKISVMDPVPVAPTRNAILRWDLALWGHIKADIGRETAQWNPRDYQTVDEAENSLNGILEKIIERHVVKTMPRSTPSHAW